MRVLIVVPEFPPFGGGAGRAAYHLASEIGDLGVQAEVLTATDRRASLAHVPGTTVNRVSIHRRSLHRSGGLAFIEFVFRGAKELRRLSRDCRFDLIHYFFSVPSGLIRFLVRHDAPYIVSLRGADVPNFAPGEFVAAHRLLTPFNRSILRNAAAVTALSRSLGEAARAFTSTVNYEVIPNGVDTSKFSPPLRRSGGAQSVKLLCVSRLVEWKGIHYLVQAIDRMKRADLSLTICGTGPYEAELRRLVNRLNLGSQIALRGAVPHDELPDIYRAADLFVLPSLGDSFGQVFTEAMACGLPIVAADQGGVPEVVIDGRNGLLTRPRDVEDLAAKLGRLIDDVNLRYQIGEHNVIDVRQRFRWRAVAEQYANIYKAVASTAA